MANNQKLHIAAFPWLAYGHLIPFFKVSKFLAQKGHQISIISTPKNIQRLPKIPPNLSSHINLIQLTLPPVEGLPEGAESTSELPIHLVPYLKKAYDKLEPELTQFLMNSNVNFIIIDFASHWLPKVATQLGIKQIHFSIFCANSLAFIGPPSDMLKGKRQKPEDFTVVPSWITYKSTVEYKLHEMVSHQACVDSDASDRERYGTVIINCDFVIVRSCFEFEPEALKLLEKLYGKPVIPVGLLPPSSNEFEEQESESWAELTRWLDGKDEKSVLYVAFGTELALSQELMHELAYGIEKSGLPFIWVVKNRPLVEGNAGYNPIPLGFEDRVSCWGLVWTNWAPQLKILSHRAIGGFLTHCGWSSVIEALGLGLPLVLFPGGSSDLGLVARLLNEKHAGLEVPRDELDGSFTSESIAESIRRVMIEPEGEPIRSNAKELRHVFGNIDLHNKYLDTFVQFLEIQ